MKPSQNITSPLDEGDHPELDTAKLCSEDQIYQSVIGSLQWIVTIRRFDVHTAVMTMSGFRILPRIGLTTYIWIFVENAIFALEPKNWTYLIYRIMSTIRLTECTVKLKNSYQKMPQNHMASMLHCHTTWMQTFCMISLSENQLQVFSILLTRHPIDWYSKKQATIETATYGSDFVAA
jgi:hypothetical protein